VVLEVRRKERSPSPGLHHAVLNLEVRERGITSLRGRQVSSRWGKANKKTFSKLTTPGIQRVEAHEIASGENIQKLVIAIILRTQFANQVSLSP
jgi:hypothetical protein